MYFKYIIKLWGGIEILHLCFTTKWYNCKTMAAVKTSSTTYIIEPVPDHPPPSYLRKHFYMLN
jgi:hypothetical protein